MLIFSLKIKIGINYKNIYISKIVEVMLKWHPENKVECTFDPQDVSILLQGVFNREVNILETIADYRRWGQVILSVYDNYENLLICENILEKYAEVIIVYNNYSAYEDEIRGLDKKIYYDNYYYQIQTTLKGLAQVDRPYVVKSRVDHYYSDMNKLIAHGIGSDKLVSTSCFVRGFEHVKFHMSDCLYFGPTEKIKKMVDFGSLKYSVENAEVKLWKPYLVDLAKQENLDIELANLDTYIKFMKSKVSIFCINLHNTYKVKYASGVYTQIYDLDKSDEEYLIWGTDFGRNDYPPIKYGAFLKN